MGLWKLLIAKHPANTEQPNQQPNQSALLLVIKAVKLYHRELRLDSGLIEFRAAPPPADGEAVLPAKPPGVPEVTIIESTMNPIKQG
jgi:hypothetical protein